LAGIGRQALSGLGDRKWLEGSFDEIEDKEQPPHRRRQAMGDDINLGTGGT